MIKRIEPKYFAKELSWLSFNERVLQEAADASVPIIERVRFLGIFSNNLDEFFRVRVANVKRRVLIEKGLDEQTPTKNLLRAIQKKVLKLQDEFDVTYLDVLKGLAHKNIFLINEDQLSPEQGNWLRQYFTDNLQGFIEPIIIDDETNLAALIKDDLTYLICEMLIGKRTQYAAIAIPTTDSPRFIELPREKGKRRRNIIMSDNIIRYCINDIFAAYFNYKQCHVYSMKVTGDADFGLTDDIDQSVLEKLSTGLKQRLHAKPVRIVYERSMSENTVQMLKSKLGITRHDSVVPGGRYHNFKDFISFPNVGRKQLENPSIPPLASKHFTVHSCPFDAIKKRDILLFYPYHKFDHFTEIVRQASFDPTVFSIKICIYRVASNSRIIKSLINAFKNGKKVLVIIELHARFDGQANMEWARILTEAGVKVHFGVPSLKCHSKLCSIGRHEKNKQAYYAHIGTGNFHEKTAKIYTDFSLFTCNPDITNDINLVFDFITHSYKKIAFKHLIVSPISTRAWINESIDNEIKMAKKGYKAEILIKMNNIDDEHVIHKLYDASSAGVKIKMIIRGMCVLVPGIEGLSENIEVISIVDRFLEHTRLVVFHNNASPKVVISSADWMTRNIERRVEVGCPILDPAIKQQLIHIFNLQWSDTTKARIIDKKQQNTYRPRGNKRKIRSQIAAYTYLKDIQYNKT